MPLDYRSAAPSSAPAVTPVADYEPPASTDAHHRPSGPLRHLRGHSAAARPHRPGHLSLPPPLQSAAVFADAALRRVLEVVDLRRPPAHLRPLLTADLAESVLSRRPVGDAAADPATLQRLRVQAVTSCRPATAVEVFGTYRRGRRVHALAGRVQRVPDGPGWQLVALHIG
ncbi:hypothetical protein KIH27_14760 [Mycobacterium sp. M1]|uniref:Alanine, arginine and proline rich protein n=1 Tax=Mycolicibacter acidiphilus TaxID=2835306 RepID=A0ABS5RKU5_9MYCO|nr:Rv3235 family protein [Mycolicibacter acidiphilus]MBS9534851.1 hypothetical protein [Mycolicibacter acidiphilus]